MNYERWIFRSYVHVMDSIFVGNYNRYHDLVSYVNKYSQNGFYSVHARDIIVARSSFEQRSRASPQRESHRYSLQTVFYVRTDRHKTRSRKFVENKSRIVIIVVVVVVEN